MRACVGGNAGAGKRLGERVARQADQRLARVGGRRTMGVAHLGIAGVNGVDHDRSIVPLQGREKQIAGPHMRPAQASDSIWRPVFHLPN